MFSFWLNPTLAKSAGNVVWVFYQVQPQGLIFSTQKLQTTKKQTLSHLNKARTGPRSAARFCKILKLCNKFIYIHYHRKYKYMGYPNVGDNCLKLIPGDIV